jgi:hypothetical protein
MRIFYIILIAGLFQSRQAPAQVKNSIEGKWAVDAGKTIDSMTAEKRTHYENMPPARKNAIKGSFETRIFDFRNDGQATISFTLNNSMKVIKAAWVYDLSIRKLTIVSDGKENEYTVLSKDNDHLQLIFSSKAPDGLFKSLFLVRVK